MSKYSPETRPENIQPGTRRIRVLILSMALGVFGPFSTGAAPVAKNTAAKNAAARKDAAAKKIAEKMNAENVLNAEGPDSGDSDQVGQQFGQLIVTGSVTVNQKKAITGTTVFTDTQIAVACAKGSGATVNLGKLGLVELTPGTKMTLRFSDGVIGGELMEGKAVVSAPAGVKVAVNTSEGVTSADGIEASVTPVVAQRGVRCIPVAVSGASSASLLSGGALAAAIAGVGGAAVAGGVVASLEDDPVVSLTTP